MRLVFALAVLAAGTINAAGPASPPAPKADSPKAESAPTPAPRDPAAEAVYSRMTGHFLGSRAAAGEGKSAEADRQLAEAASAALQYVAREPRRWEAPCVFAAMALARRPPDRVDAARWLAGLCAPAKAPPDTTAFWFTAVEDLIRRLGDEKRADEIVEYVAGTVFRRLADRTAEAAAAAGGPLFPVLSAFQRATGLLEKRPEMAESFAGYQELCRRLTESADTSPADLRELGRLQDRSLNMIAEYRRRRLKGFTTDGECAAATKAVEENITAIWERLLKADPKDAVAYIGRAAQLNRAGKSATAGELLDEALKLCGKGDYFDLVVAKVTLLRTTGLEESAMRFLDRAMEADPDDMRLASMAVEAAMTDGRYPRTVRLCRAIADRKPKLYWVRRTEAAACMRLNRPEEAIAALEALRDQTATDADGAKLYVAALGAAGRLQDADAFIERLLADPKLNSAGKAWSAAAAAAAGFAEINLFAETCRWAERAVAAEPDNLPARHVLADALRAQCDVGLKQYDPDFVRKTVGHYEFILAKSPDDAGSRNNLVWLYLRGLNDADAAWRVSEPLRKAADDARFPPEVLDTLAALHLRRREYKEALELCSRTLSSPRPRIAYYCNAAEALLGLGRFQDARTLLDKAVAMNLPASARQEAEFVAVIKKVRAACDKPKDEAKDKPKDEAKDKSKDEAKDKSKDEAKDKPQAKP